MTSAYIDRGLSIISNCSTCNIDNITMGIIKAVNLTGGWDALLRYGLKGP